MDDKVKEEIRQIAAEQNILIREARRIALTRIEEAARTEEDFENIIKNWWNKLDSNRERRKRDYVVELEEMTIDDVEITDDGAVIPQPIDHKWWRQMMHGDFLDVIFDCPYDLHEMTSSKSISEMVKRLRDNQKEVLYLRAICQLSPQTIAAVRGQTDRNILKVYDTLITGLRKRLYEGLSTRYEQGLPLTNTQHEFLKNYKRKYGGIKRP